MSIDPDTVIRIADCTIADEVVEVLAKNGIEAETDTAGEIWEEAYDKGRQDAERDHQQALGERGLASAGHRDDLAARIGPLLHGTRGSDEVVLGLGLADARIVTAVLEAVVETWPYSELGNVLEPLAADFRRRMPRRDMVHHW